MQLFRPVAPEYASMSGVSRVILPEKSESSQMLMPTISEISPEPYTVMTGSENTLPGFVTNEPPAVRALVRHVLVSLGDGLRRALDLRRDEHMQRAVLVIRHECRSVDLIGVHQIHRDFRGHAHRSWIIKNYR